MATPSPTRPPPSPSAGPVCAGPALGLGGGHGPDGLSGCPEPVRYALWLDCEHRCLSAAVLVVGVCVTHACWTRTRALPAAPAARPMQLVVMLCPGCGMPAATVGRIRSGSPLDLAVAGVR